MRSIITILLLLVFSLECEKEKKESTSTTDGIGTIELNEGYMMKDTIPTIERKNSITVIGLKDKMLIDKRNGQHYKTVKIGNQIWMAENLNYKIDSSWCYNNDENNCNRYGRLYSWDAALSACPAGWHLPSDEEWMTLEITLGMSRAYINKTGYRGGSDQGSQLKQGGTSGFNALLSGLRFPDGEFKFLGNHGLFWTCSRYNSIAVSCAWYRSLSNNDSRVFRHDWGQTYGYCVRCVKN